MNSRLMANLVGQVLQQGQYHIEQELGRGGFGVTYRAARMPLNQIVVIKTLHTQQSINLAEQQQKFQEEARRLAQCKHPNIVNVTDFFIENGLPYLVMDYIPGHPLSEIVFPHSPLPEADALYYIRQIGEALQVVHRQGLLHRDVKPQNIMIHDLTGEAILIDFGIARELTARSTQTHTSLVSEGYAPIEQYLPKAHRSAATDVYGLAATLYSLVTGEVPVASVLRSHQPLIPPRQLCPTLNPAVEQAILQGMAVNLAERPQSIATWQTLLEGKRLPRSTAATQVVAPGYAPTQAAPPERPRSRSWFNRQSATAAGDRTAVSPAPPASPASAIPEAYPPAPRRQRGPSFFSTVRSLLVIGLLGGLGLGGYRVYQQVTQKIAEIRQQPIFSIELPSVEVPDLSEWAKQPVETAEVPEEAPESEGGEPEPEPDEGNLITRLPQILRNSGNPNTASPGGNGSITSVPGFSPGTAASQISQRLGAPTRQAIRDNFETAVYDLVPNQASVAYVYDQASEQVAQVEAAFAPSFDRLMMRTTLVGMLDHKSSKDIEQGLESVRQGEIDSYPFETNQFKGSIERNQNGFIYIRVSPR
ncbi:MAG: serine/threonine-protein kinase [Cyanobacteria bacterium P01_A01_bin.114]